MRVRAGRPKLEAYVCHLGNGRRFPDAKTLKAENFSLVCFSINRVARSSKPEVVRENVRKKRDKKKDSSRSVTNASDSSVISKQCGKGISCRDFHPVIPHVAHHHQLHHRANYIFRFELGSIQKIQMLHRLVFDFHFATPRQARRRNTIVAAADNNRLTCLMGFKRTRREKLKNTARVETTATERPM